MKTFLIEILIRYYLGDEIHKKKISRTGHKCGGRGEVHTQFWWGNPRKKATWEA
jgi:hypothetical protein